MWVALLFVAGLALAPIGRFASLGLSDTTLAQADDATVREKLSEPWPAAATANYFETLSELAMEIRPTELDSARRAAERAVAIDPQRGFVWANLAYLDYVRDARITSDVLKALEASMRACPLCDAGLVRWRFNFVLSNWKDMPESLRRKAFEQADLLRWTGENGEFLAQMRVKAQGNGIPYDDYRAAVKTPARTWELGPQAPRSPS